MRKSSTDVLYLLQLKYIYLNVSEKYRHANNRKIDIYMKTGNKDNPHMQCSEENNNTILYWISRKHDTKKTNLALAIQTQQKLEVNMCSP